MLDSSLSHLTLLPVLSKITSQESSIKIRPIQAHDAAAFHQLWRDVYCDSGHLVGAPPSLKKIEQVVATIVAEGYPQLMMFDNTKLVGSIEVLPASMFSSKQRNNSHIGAVGIMLLAGYRRQGLASQLLEQAIEASENYGFYQLTAQIYPQNQASIRLFEKFAFRQQSLTASGKIQMSLTLNNPQSVDKSLPEKLKI